MRQTDERIGLRSTRSHAGEARLKLGSTWTHATAGASLMRCSHSADAPANAPRSPTHAAPASARADGLYAHSRATKTPGRMRTTLPSLRQASSACTPNFARVSARDIAPAVATRCLCRAACRRYLRVTRRAYELG